ncbi:Spc98 family-domain-containing protein [Phlebopus sp. FC_14]|nr:Spc98 family-domain-containing protein [Phlebopus sp. FC_14]
MAGNSDWSEESENFLLPPLPPVLPHFFVPPLDDEPQDLIVHHPAVQKTSSVSTPFLVPPTSSQNIVPPSKPDLKAVSLLWSEAASLDAQHVGSIISWDSVHKPNNKKCPKTSFLTEQSSDIFNSIQKHAEPCIHTQSTRVIRISERDLLDSLKLLVLGTSSRLHVWDATSQSFLIAGSSKAQPLAVVIEDKNDTMSQSILQLFLRLGTHVRRIELFIHEFHTRSGRVDSTAHAFAHSLSTVLTYLRDCLSQGPLFGGDDSSKSCCLASVWLHYAELGQIAHSLASLCRRNVELTPEDYAEFPSSAVDLLSLVYETLEMHMHQVSSREVTAINAYILTVSSQPYIRALCKSVTFGQTRHLVTVDDLKPLYLDAATFLDGGRRGHWVGGNDAVDADGPFPKFIPSYLADILPGAQKSLKLLEAAQPAQLIGFVDPSRDMRWAWSSAEIDAMWNGTHDTSRKLKTGGIGSFLEDARPIEPQTKDDRPELAGFRIFDMEPGSHPSHTSRDRVSQSDVREFITKFSSTLPSVTPNLSLLCDLVFSPLQSHATSLSSTLLSVFLDQNSSLCIDIHLEVLRSHMLLTSHSFKSRLTAALFSDAEDPEAHGNGVKSYNLLRYKESFSAPRSLPYTRRWAIGLAPSLMARDIWPPGGADLSFLLRTVIVSSQECGYDGANGAQPRTDAVSRVTEEAEFRLGFAVRDLPAGTGRERWLDPLSIEALDFLYIDYKVPPSMEVLISSAVLSKYQRVFVFLLRMIRVESAIRATFRLMRTSSNPLFPTFPSSNQLLLHFRFVAQSFISTVSAHVYETAIKGNFDVFLSRIAACRESFGPVREFRDVFALAERHSSVLDDILTACLLRSSQRTAGDLLRRALELILEFCVLVGDLRDGRLEEYQAHSELKVLHAAFRKKVSTLVKALEILLEKDAKLTQRAVRLPVNHGESEHRTLPGGTECLRHFLTRLDLSDWWKEW